MQVTLYRLHRLYIGLYIGKGMCMCAYTYVHIFVCNNSKREDMNLKESKGRYVGAFEGKKGKEEI